MKPRHQSNANTEEIRAGIEQTRARMDDTLDQLTERLKPRHLLDEVLDYFQSRRESGSQDGERVKHAATEAKDKAADVGRVIVRQVKQHPMPAMLIGAGLAWLLMESDKDENNYSGEEGYAELYSEDAAEIYYERQGGYPATPDLVEGSESGMEGAAEGKMAEMKGKAQHLKAKAGEKMEHMRRRTSDRAHRLRAKASQKGAEWKEQSQEMYEQGIESFKRTADEHPLVTATGFLALGLLAGMLLPSTRKEDEAVGPARDRLIERGKQMAQSVAEAAKSEAREQGLTPEGLKESGSHILENVKAAVREEGLTPSGLKEKAQAVGQEAKETAQREANHEKNETQVNV